MTIDISSGTRVCNVCGEEKPLALLVQSSKRGKCGREPLCKKCRNIRNLEKLNTVKKFNISPKEYLNILKSQRGTCAICNRKNIIKNGEKERRLVIDHDHQSSKIRGLLCTKCNAALGLFQDDIMIVKKAWEYLHETTF